MLMRIRRIKKLEKVLLFLFTAVILFGLVNVGYDIIFWSYRSPSLLALNSEDILSMLEDKKLYFETESGYKERLSIQDKILFGAMIKRSGGEVFEKREGYNEERLDRLPLVRTIPDFKPAGCSNLTYNETSTTVSVVINYHNEVLSLLLRTIYSAINAIPPQNFKELILIDDASNLTAYYHLRIVQPLVDTFSVPVRFLRFEVNRGLVFCRRFGAQNAKGDVVLILDSHVELSPGFIPPLLNITDNNYKAIAAPIFDFYETFEDRHWHYDGLGFAFDQYLGWKFSKGPKGHLPWRTPGVMGGAFVATKRRLEELDYFGRGLVGWGGENIEISMKWWMCGGEMYFVPCSRCLHFAAKRWPDNHGDRVKPNNPMLNIATVAKSYFNDEEYQEYLRGRSNAINAHDEEAVNINKNLLKQLNCSRDYKWMRRRLMVDVESFDQDTLIAHTLQKGGKCVVVYNDRNHWILEPCLTKEGRIRAIINRPRLTKHLELRYGPNCLDFGFKEPSLTACHAMGGAQKIYYNLKEQRIRSGSKKCLTQPSINSTTLEFKHCVEENGDISSQTFQFEVIYHPEMINKDPH